MQFEDILYEVRNGVAWITINRPDKMNAFRGTTCDEIIKAMNKAGYDRSVGAIVLAGAGERAFCTGGDQRIRDKAGYQYETAGHDDEGRGPTAAAQGGDEGQRHAGRPLAGRLACAAVPAHSRCRAAGGDR